MSERVQRFANHLAGAGSASNTVEAYGRGVRRFETFLAKYKTRIEDMPPHTLRSFVADMVGSEIAPNTCRLYMTGVKQYMEFLREDGVKAPMLLRAKIPRHKERVREYLTDDLLQTYMRWVRHNMREPHGTFLLLLPMTGLRVTEMRQMKVADVGIGQGHVTFYVRDPSSKDESIKSDERAVPMIPDGRHILASYLRHVRPKLNDRLRKLGRVDEEYLFPNKYGGSVKVGVIQKKMRYLRDEIEIPKLTAHVLRHTYATILFENGVDPIEIQRCLGHRSLETTKIYVHTSMSKIRESVGAIQKCWTAEEA